MKYFINYEMYKKHNKQGALVLWYETIDYNLEKGNIDIAYICLQNNGFYIRLYKDDLEVDLNKLYDIHWNKSVE